MNVTFKYQLIRSDVCENCSGPTEIRTRIAGFKVQSANHYTIGPIVIPKALKSYTISVSLIFVWLHWAWLILVSTFNIMGRFTLNLAVYIYRMHLG